MAIEINYFKNIQTWELVPRMQGDNVVKCQWVYNTKFTFDSDVEHHKDHLIDKGFSQQKGINNT